MESETIVFEATSSQPFYLDTHDFSCIENAFESLFMLHLCMI